MGEERGRRLTRPAALLLPGEGHVFIVRGADPDRCLAESGNHEQVFCSSIDYLVDSIARYLKG